MDQSISHGWRRRITIALANPPIDLPIRPSPRCESEAGAAAVERKSRRVWRALSWVLFANMLLFWLLTCVTAFAQLPNWAGVHLIYTPSTSSYTYALAAPNTLDARDEGIKFRVQTTDAPIEGQPVVALQRLTLLPQGRVWLSADANEVASMRAQGWQLDGTLGFIAPQRTTDTIPLYRFTQDAFQLSLYTTKSPGKNWLQELFGWRDAEIVGYVKAATDRQNELIGKWIDSRPVEQGPPTITSIAPATGQVGTTIQIGGSHFTDSSSVRFNGVAALAVNKLSAVALQVTVPTGATTGKITVTTAKGSATSASVFTIATTPPTDLPTVASFAPQSGLAGSVVTITGTYLVGTTSVKFNGVSSAAVTSISATSLQASVPSGASSGKISVTTAMGTATSTAAFTVTTAPPVELPTLASFAPLSGLVGSVVTITGTNLSGATSVKFNGVSSASVSNVSATSLQASVPANAGSGKISVTTAMGTATSTTAFNVTTAPPAELPTVASFAPLSGLAGSVVTITGTNLVGTTGVKFNGVSSGSVTSVTATSLQAIVPANTTSGKIIVTTAKGTATSSSSFSVTLTPPPKVTSFAPQVGQSGSVITITGTNLTGATSVKFNGVSSATVTNITESSLQASVPATAGSGKISVTTSIGTGTSTTDFTVTVAPPVVDAAQKEVLRFLTQATFGPKPASVERVKAIGIPAWIDEQFTKPAELHMSYIDAAKARRVAAMGKSYYAEEDSYEAIWQQWLFGSDELRARMSFALSELMVISNIAPDLEAEAMSSYMDTLNQHAFGNYRDLLGAVTLHPTMGYYLNMLGSEKEDTSGNKHPNENYAREVLQLFSVGLVMLNPDGSRKVDGAGVPIPSYDENVVKGFARAFTGWTFAGNDPANPKKFDRPEENWTKPMIAFASKHETGTKSLLSGVTLPAGQTAEKDMKDALDNIFNHPNVGPFIGRQLILRFVTSNPSPAYIARVSAVFDNNGRGVRGDLGAVIKAVLTDSDARSDALSGDAKFGKQREPVIRFANILRAFNATADNGRNNIHYLDNADDALGQSPLLSPSVFNFFSPFYTRPGRLAQSGMFGPEFQITNEIQTVGTANFFYQLVKKESFGNGDSKLKLDLVQAKSLANNSAQLVDYLSGLLTYGDLSLTSRQIIVDAVTAVPFNNRDTDRSWRVRTALTLFALSSDFVIQK